jgi:glucose/arabinose dehydrogenase
MQDSLSRTRFLAALAGTLAGTWALAAPKSIDLPSAQAYPESLSSAQDGTLYVGNLAEGGIWRIRPNGKPESWIKPGAFGSASILGVLVDEPSNSLWVCSDDLSAMGLKIPGAGPGSALIGFDLKTGAGKVRAQFAGEHNFCNDIAIAADGSAYVTNSDTPQILRLPPGGKKLEVWFTEPSLAPATHDGTGIDGIAFGGDGNLYINTFDAGELYRVDVKDGKAGKLTKLKPSRKLAGTDGMRPTGPATFLLIEGNAGKVDAITVKGDDVSVTTLHDGYVTPTGVTPVGNTAWVTEGQLDFLFEPKLKGQKPRLPFRVYAVPMMGNAMAMSGPSSEASVCKGDNGGLSLSPGFCATIFADNVGHARHMAVSDAGVVYVNTWSGDYFDNDKVPDGGFLLALQDTQHSGQADVIKRFGDGVAEKSAGGTGIRLYKNYLYAEENDKIIRYAMKPGEIVPTGKAQVVISGMPITGDHPMHPFIIDHESNLFVDLGSETNACEEKNRVPLSPGHQPCTEKETRGGIWRYDANKLDQHFSAAERYASGIRNGEGMAIDKDGRLFVTQHGRDQLLQDWPKLYSPQRGPLLPAEEVMELKEGADYGWPECYFDGFQKKLVLAPEYGGDGGKTVGLCADRTAPVAFYPAHFAPNALLIDLNSHLPAVYREGAFIAFHGSWNRTPIAQDGYNVVFQPMKAGKVSGPYIVFADGFAGASKEPGRAAFRPAGLAAGPDGSLYVADDMHGRIWRITYQGAGPAKLAAAPPIAAAEPAATAGGQSSSLTPPSGVTAEQLALGEKIYLGKARNGTCAGCHGSDGKGSAVGADLTAGKWIWSDGSLPALTKTISQGVTSPKSHMGAMPPNGGTQLSASDLKAVSAYVWAIGHPAHN